MGSSSSKYKKKEMKDEELIQWCGIIHNYNLNKNK